MERLGEEFFRTLPTSQGVYLMCGEREGVLYVGKCRNLRKRLSSYRVANRDIFRAGSFPSYIGLRRIKSDVCVNEDVAHYREAELMCVLQPRFNKAGVV